jgi:hypothetical protein
MQLFETIYFLFNVEGLIICDEEVFELNIIGIIKKLISVGGMIFFKFFVGKN